MARPKADSWVAAVEKHAKEGLILIVAYLGGSAEQGWKLYTNAELTAYIEVDDSDIVDSLQLKAEHSPLGGSLVWVKRDATLRHTRTTSRSVQASFLQGNDFANVQTRQGPYPGQTGRDIQPYHLSWTMTCVTYTPILTQRSVMGICQPNLTPITPMLGQ